MNGSVSKSRGNPWGLLFLEAFILHGRHGTEAEVICAEIGWFSSCWTSFADIVSDMSVLHS